MGRDRRAEVTGHLEGGALGELGIPRNVERHLEPKHVVAAGDAVTLDGVMLT
jgi:hypothetical protein